MKPHSIQHSGVKLPTLLPLPQQTKWRLLGRCERGACIFSFSCTMLTHSLPLSLSLNTSPLLIFVKWII